LARNAKLGQAIFRLAVLFAPTASVETTGVGKFVCADRFK